MAVVIEYAALALIGIIGYLVAGWVVGHLKKQSAAPPDLSGGADDSPQPNADVKIVYCPGGSCGYPNQRGARFCAKCGFELT